MLHLGVLLFAGGVVGVWRAHRLRQSRLVQLQARHVLPDQNGGVDTSPGQLVQVFDDVDELHHYQRVSWYSLAFSASGSWFYPPVALVSVPLLGYNAYHLAKTIRQSNPVSPMTVFEVIAVAGTVLTGRPVMASVLMLFSFGARKLLLQAGNISHNVDFTRPINPRVAKVWVMRDGAEIECVVADVRSQDIVVLNAGETVPFEGRVLEGEGYIRQFSLSKQMKFIPKQTGDRVHPFAYLQSGCLHIQPA